MGRPLRRELYKLISGSDKFADIPVIRPVQQPVDAKPINNDNDDDDAALSKASSRKVYIPSQINHIALVCNDGNDGELGYKLAIAKEKWLHYKQHEGAKKALVFVPNYEDISQAESILKFWGISEVRTLEKSLGTDNVGNNVDEILKNALNNKVKRVGATSSNSDADQDELIVLSYACARGLHVSTTPPLPQLTHSLTHSLTYLLTYSLDKRCGVYLCFGATKEYGRVPAFGRSHVSAREPEEGGFHHDYSESGRVEEAPIVANPVGHHLRCRHEVTAHE